MQSGASEKEKHVGNMVSLLCTFSLVLEPKKKKKKADFSKRAEGLLRENQASGT